MSKKVPLPDWEFKIVQNDSTRKCASVPEGAFFVEVLLKKEPQHVFSSRELIETLRDKKNKIEKEVLRNLLVNYAGLSRRVEALNANVLVENSASHPKNQLRADPQVVGGNKPVAISSRASPAKSAKPVEKKAGARTKQRPGVIRRRPNPECEESAPPVAPATSIRREASVSAQKGGGSGAKAKKRKTEEKVAPVANISKQSASEKGKRKAVQPVACASEPLKPSSTEHVAKRVRSAAALLGKKGTGVGRQGKDDSAARPTRTSCYPTVDELLQYVHQSRPDGDTQLSKSVADEYRDVMNSHFERMLDTYSKQHFPTWLEHLQLDRNVLLYGAGCKQRLLRRFASDMLQDEDVLELTAPRSAPDGSEELKPVNKKSNIATGTGEQGAASTLNTRENVVWSLFETIKRQILGLRKDGAAASDFAHRLAQRGGGVAGHGIAPDGRARRSASSSCGYGASNVNNSSSSAMSDESAVTGVAYKREMQEKWYCYQESSSVIVEEARLLCDMLLTHYNWRSVSERGNQAAALARASSSGLKTKSSDLVGFNSDIDGIDDNDDEEILGNGSDRQLAGTSVDSSGASSGASRGSLENGGGLTNMAYDNSICRLYLLVHNIEDVFPLVQESSIVACPNSEHQMGELAILLCLDTKFTRVLGMPP